MYRVVKRTGIKRTQKTFNAFNTIMRGQVQRWFVVVADHYATSIVHNLHMCKLKSSVSSLYSGTGRSSCRAGKNRLMLLW